MGPVTKSVFDYIKLSFKEGLQFDFVRRIQQNIEARQWEQTPIQPANAQNRVCIIM